MPAFFCELKSEALLQITGQDAQTFLQGQLTCDVREAEATSACTGAYCNPQGRVLADFLLLQPAPERYFLRLRKDVLASTVATLGKFIVFSKAALEAEPAHWQLYGCWGEVAPILQSLVGKLPGGKKGLVTGAGYCLVQLDGAGKRFELYLDAEQNPELVARLSTQLQPESEQRWQALEIRCGEGRIEAATVAEFLPQMLNYDLTGQLSFTKGCYTGQEVIARLHYRGKSKRRMYLAQLPGTETPAAGTLLYRPNSEQSAGAVVNCAATTDGAIIALVVTTAVGREQGLHLGAPAGPQLSFGELPYPLI